MNTLYSYGRQGFLEGAVAWTTDTIRVVLTSENQYTFSDSHQYLVDVPVSARVAISDPLTLKTTDGGVADAADLIFVAPVGLVSSALIIYKQGGSDATSRLIAYMDSMTGLPVTPDGSNITIAWDNSPDKKIFKL